MSLCSEVLKILTHRSLSRARTHLCATWSFREAPKTNVNGFVASEGETGSQIPGLDPGLSVLLWFCLRL